VFSPALGEMAEAIARARGALFRRQEGLDDLRSYIGEDGVSLVSVFSWRSKADHEACMQSPDFASVGARWNELAAYGATMFDMWTGSPT